MLSAQAIAGCRLPSNITAALQPAITTRHLYLYGIEAGTGFGMLNITLFSIFRWGEACLFLKKPAEIQWVVIACNGSYFSYIIFSVFKKALCIAYTYTKYIIKWCRASVKFKIPYKPACAHIFRCCIFCNIYRTVIMFVKVSYSSFYFILGVFAGYFSTPVYLSVKINICVRSIERNSS